MYCRIKIHLLNIVAIFVLSYSCGPIEEYHYDYTPTMVSADHILNDDSEYIIVIGDTQIYTSFGPTYYYYYASTMDWIWSQVKHGKNIQCVLHVGDITDNNLPQQYDVFWDMTAPTAELIPYIACTGNHDYDWDANGKIVSRYSSRLSQYVSFPTTESKIVSRFEAGYMDNIVVENYINGERYDIISLEFGPRVEVVEWAKQHVQAYPDIKFILLTHEYLSFENIRISQDSHAHMHFVNTNTTYSTPEQLWENLIQYSNNVVCVICGHNGFTGNLYSKNVYDRNVVQSMFNLQFQSNGGDGWIQIWEFPKSKDVAKVITYNIFSRKENTYSSFEFKYKY